MKSWIVSHICDRSHPVDEKNIKAIGNIARSNRDEEEQTSLQFGEEEASFLFKNKNLIECLIGLKKLWLLIMS